MPVDSTDHGPADGHRGHRRLRAVLRWLPAAVLVVIAAAAGVVVLRDVGTPRAAARADDGRSPTPVLSLRRDLEPLRTAAADHALRTGLDRFLAGQPADTCLAVEVGDLDYEHRVDDPQTPASLEKLLTAVAALTEMGPDATFETDTLAEPAVGGVVPGNLYLRGGGDPILATAPYVARERNQPQIFSDIDQLADAVVASGVSTISGSVVGDDTRYDAVRYNPAWPSRFIRQGQIGPISALSVNDGFAYFPGENSGVFGAAEDPPAYAAAVLDGALRARGVQIGGPPVSGPTPAAAEVLATHQSPPLAQIVTEMLHESDNNTAELLLKELGVRRQDQGSFEAGRAAVTAILTEAGLDLTGTNIADGSGLSSDDSVTCDLLVDLLDHESTAPVLQDALAVVGESGTLARRWRDSDLVGTVRAKTGTLNQVTGLAGLADTAGGGEATFALVVNLPATETIQPATVAAQRQLAQLLHDHPDLPDVDAVRPGRSPGG